MKITEKTNISRTNESLNYQPDREKQFKETLSHARDIISSAATTATGLSGGPLMSLASAASSATGSSVSSDTLMQKTLQEQNQKFNMDFLKLQNDIQTENRKYTTLSNISKARHDTAKSAINNMRV
ncbi:hypothetical protein KKF34_13105 [Myxococcota bacterium]|nr:hypothetical protein [Myxococcota bacterium]MBU1381905.1 hypothetical protein [Myxococcota bacterium]MBU1497806.1 hypothetical protein [Myxococcota bacterium]